jgi:hypothetical protein
MGVKILCIFWTVVVFSLIASPQPIIELQIQLCSKRQCNCRLAGRSPYTREVKAEKSAEAIVVVEYELRIDTVEVLQINEGLNDRLFEIR